MTMALNNIASFYHKVLVESDAGSSALSYLKDRKFTDETIADFEVGFVPTSIINYIKQGALTYSELEALVDLSHLFKVGHKKYKDKFAGRITFPVRDSVGRVKGFAARTITDELPKYLNSTESTSYHKAHSLYGLNLAKEAIFDRDKAILCEGYTDAMAFHQSGVKYAVACGGTHATKYQLAQIARYSANIFLAFDADAAGDQVTAAAHQSAVDMGLTVGKLDIPRGKDPADILLK